MNEDKTRTRRTFRPAPLVFFALLFLFWDLAISSSPYASPPSPTTRPARSTPTLHKIHHNTPTKTSKTTTPPNSKDTTEQASHLLASLFKGDDEFLRTHPSPYFQRFCDQQTPEITLVMCSDSRVHETLFHSDPNNHIFTVRNIGNQMLTAMGSVDYGVLHLKTPLLIIMGHTHCGAIHAAMNPYEGEPIPIISELDHLFSPLKPLLQNKGKRTPHALWTLGVEHNVDYQVQIAARRYQKQILAKKLHILGIIDDIANIYGYGFGRIVLTNINGETRLQALRQHPLVRHYTEATKKFHIYRPRSAHTPSLSPLPQTPTTQHNTLTPHKTHH
ncbi:carbonic anhydrase [Myxococcota bacterium]|nr:carbonic anhydrase [Myxococcota bacterium]